MARARNTTPTPKKQCQECGKEKALSNFYKVKSDLFPDGSLNTCSKCIRETVNIEDIKEVISFLRQVNKPYIEKYWNEALASGNYPLGEYMRKVNSLSQVKESTFDNSRGDGTAVGTSEDVLDDIYDAKLGDSIETEEGETVYYDDSLIDKWGIGYRKNEYLRLEKFYVDMEKTHEVITANHKQILRQLAKLSLEMDSLLAMKDYGNYDKVSKAYDSLMKSGDFRPVDRKNGADANGLSSFSQVWADIEREGFIPPRMLDIPPDDIDYMLMYYMQFAQRFVGKDVSTHPPKHWRNDIVFKEDEDESDERE